MGSFPETYNDPHRDFAFDIYIGSLLSKIYFTSIVYYIYTFCTYIFFVFFSWHICVSLTKKETSPFKNLLKITLVN